MKFLAIVQLCPTLENSPASHEFATPAEAEAFAAGFVAANAKCVASVGKSSEPGFYTELVEWRRGCCYPAGHERNVETRRGGAFAWQPVALEPATVHPEVIAVRRALEGAPAVGAPVAADLLGWWTPFGFYVCAPCAARMIARGCSVPTRSTPAWRGEPFGVCVGHEAATGL